MIGRRIFIYVKFTINKRSLRAISTRGRSRFGVLSFGSVSKITDCYSESLPVEHTDAGQHLKTGCVDKNSLGSRNSCNYILLFIPTVNWKLVIFA